MYFLNILSLKLNLLYFFNIKFKISEVQSLIESNKFQFFHSQDDEVNAANQQHASNLQEVCNRNDALLKEKSYFTADNEDFEDEQTLLINKDDLTKRIAPGEGIAPVSLLSDKDAEELTFLKIYGGQRFQPNARVTYAARCKSEFRRYDRRCAENIQKIFYSYRKLVTKKLNASIDVSMSKTREAFELTVEKALDKENINSLIARNEANLFLRTIRSSPQYWEWKKMELNSMITQLGCPTFFITLSPAEIDWDELIVLLVKTLRDEDISQETASQMDRNEKIELVSKDPITVARYFVNRMSELLKFTFHKNGPFKDNPVIDYFWRIEFQYRGSPHIHLVAWNQNAPLFNKDLKDDEYEANNARCIDFIDKYISIERPQMSIVNEDEYEFRQTFKQNLRSVPIKFQTHVHKSNCLLKDENKKEVCKYGFPWPIMDITHILEPLDCEKPERLIAKQKYYKVREELVNVDLLWKNEKKETTLEELLSKLNFSYENYLLALRASIKRTTVFLKRSCKELMINPYNKSMYVRHRANMDIQFVTDPYGAAAYITAYMLKSNASMSQLLKLAVEEVMANDNMTVRQRLVHVANKFNNCSEVSAQECTFTLLSMPVSRLSRETCYINTYPIEERNLILKENRFLEQLDPKSKKIFRIGLMEHYMNRPNEMKDMCLAEFAAFYDYVSNSQLEKLLNKHKLNHFPEDDDDVDDDNIEVNFFSNQNEDKDQNSANESEEEEEDDDEERNQNVVDFDQSNTQFTRKSPSQTQQSVEDVQNTNTNVDMSKYIKLKNKDGFIKKRQRAKILRYKRYSNILDPQNYFRVQILLYYPWMDEKKDIERIGDFFDYFIMHNDLIAENRAKVCKSSYEQENEYTKAQEQVEEEITTFYDRLFSEETDESENADERRNGLIDRLNQANEDLLFNMNQERHEEYEMDFGYHAQMYDEGISGVKTIQLDDKFDTSVINLPQMMNDNEYSNLMMSLNRDQHKFMCNFMHKMKKCDQEPIFNIITGGAGTGKSHLIKAIYQTFIRYCLKKSNKKEVKRPYAILGAYTGKASFNIRGSTLHSLFHLPTKSSELKDMHKDLCAKIKRQYEHLKLIILDEVSMISRTMFERINLRMQQIMNCNEPFGGINVILVGDFNQLRPVAGSWIFENERGKPGELYKELQFNQNTSLWHKFKLYELSEIMRQRDDFLFAQALNTLGKYGPLGLTDDQVKWFNDRIQTSDDISLFPRDALILCYEIEKCNDYNRRKIESITDKPLIENFALDIACGEEKKTQAAKNFASTIKYKNDFVEQIGLPNLIRFKVGCKYMITSNIRIDDGLVNGCVGTLREMIFTNNYNYESVRTSKPLVKRIYMDFSYDEWIGKKTREKENKTHRHLDKVDLNCIYTIMECTQKKIPKARAKYHAERLQYSLVECESMTIHKSQGQTYERVVVDIGSSNLSRALLYVGLSRVTSLNGLTLVGARSILPPGYENKTFEERKQECAKRLAMNSVQKEMTRLRKQAPFHNIYSFLDLDNHGTLSNRNNVTNVCVAESVKKNKRDKELNILCINIQSLNSNRAKLKRDFGFLNADLIFLVECHNNLHYRIQANVLFDQTHNMIYFSSYYDPSSTNPSNGQILYERKTNGPSRVRLIANNCDHDLYMYKNKKDLVEMALFEYKHLQNNNNYNNQINTNKIVFILCIYKHPDMSNGVFLKQIIEFLELHLPNSIYLKPSQSTQTQTLISQYSNNGQSTSNLIIIGDFNLDFNQKQNRLEQMDSFGFEPLFVNVQTHNAGNQLDWAFKNTKFEYNIKANIYETYYSDHSAIWTRIKF